ncbi:MFS transporter [Streptomyces sp. NPDC101234]|uniref:MFS transporter n=1 Tax=Streptomyces sp. NPDC101234 TaxID=3366138 RepID=UPI0038118078
MTLLVMLTSGRGLGWRGALLGRVRGGVVVEVVAVSLRPECHQRIPARTLLTARAACPKGTPAMLIRDRLDVLFEDEEFAALYPDDGRLGRGFSLLRMGLVFLPVAVATGIGAHLGSRLVGRIGSRPTAVAGMAIAAGGSVPLTRLSAGGSVYAGLLPGLVIASFGLGAVFVTATTTALAMVAHEEAGLASGVVNTSREVGGSIGVAVMSTVAAAGIEHGAVGGFGRLHAQRGRGERAGRPGARTAREAADDQGPARPLRL